MLNEVYNRRILELAGGIPRLGRLEQPDASALTSTPLAIRPRSRRTVFADLLVPILLFPLVQRLMRRGVIEREERYLESKFGNEYVQYKGKVPRWI